MYRVLCVEDEVEFREDIAAFLRLHFFEVDEAGNGKEALEILQRLGHYDLVLCDIRMPDMNGYDLLRAVRRLEGERQLTPFVFLTALNDKHNIVEARNWGCDEYLMKPIDFELLLSTIRTRIERQRASDFMREAVRQGLSSRLRYFIAEEMYMPLAEIAHSATQLCEALPDNVGHALHSRAGQMRQRTQQHAMRARQLSEIMNDRPLFAAANGQGPQDCAMYGAQVALRSFGQEARSQIFTDCDGPLPNLPLKEVTLALSMLLEAAHRGNGEAMQGLSLAGNEDALTAIVADRKELLYDDDYQYVGLSESTDLRGLQELLRGRVLPLLYAERLVATLGGSLSLKCIDNRFLVVRLHLPAMGSKTQIHDTTGAEKIVAIANHYQ